MLLEDDQEVLSQRLLVSAFSFGVREHMNVELGTVLPAWVLFPYGANLYASVKLGGSPTENLHLALGAQTLAAPLVGIFARYGYGALTLGDERAHLTVSGGAAAEENIDLQLALNVSGAWQPFEHWAFISENWLAADPTPHPASVGMAHALGTRWLNGRFALGAGLYVLGRSGDSRRSLLPWLELTWEME